MFGIKDALAKAYHHCLNRFAYLELGLLQISKNPYWKKLWIVQDIVLAKELLVVVGE
jgi:hypothetical protein